MKKVLLLSVAITLILSSCHTIYKYEKFETVRNTHKNVAIIPLELTIDPQSMPYEQPVAEFKALQKEEASFLQNFSYAIFSKKAEKNKYSIDFQNIIETNKFVLDTTFHYDDFTFENPAKLARKCNTDVVLIATFYRSNPIMPSGTYRNRIDVKFSVYDKNGKLMWELHANKSRSSKKSSISVSKKLIKKLTRRFPYKYKLFEKRKTNVSKVM